jgi:spore germination cell wall hydrolase CwlJ-like protein
MKLFVRLPALSAACALLLLAATLTEARADTGAEASVTRAMSRDNPALVRAAVSQFFGVRPKARDEAATAATPEKLDLASLDAMPAATGGGDDQRCLAEAIYHESRGEPLAGQVAVAEVVLNRVDDRQFPKTVCGVTNQGAGSGRGCQFSYACDGRSDAMKSAEARSRAEKLAALMLAGRPRTVTDGATYFHTRAVRPSWARKMTRTNAIGHHYFYRPATRVASN